MSGLVRSPQQLCEPKTNNSQSAGAGGDSQLAAVKSNSFHKRLQLECFLTYDPANGSHLSA